jgi:hypothetical protein
MSDCNACRETDGTSCSPSVLHPASAARATVAKATVAFIIGP